MSSAIAAREKRPLVPETPTRKKDRKAELKALEHQHNIIGLLRGWTVRSCSTPRWPTTQTASRFFLNSIRPSVFCGFRHLRVLRWCCYAVYLKPQKHTASDPTIQVVLASTDSVANLKRAYPNFYVDTDDFIDAITEEIY